MLNMLNRRRFSIHYLHSLCIVSYFEACTKHLSRGLTCIAEFLRIIASVHSRMPEKLFPN